MDSVQFKSFFRSLDLSSLGHTIEAVEEDTEGPADVFSGDVTIRNGKKTFVLSVQADLYGQIRYTHAVSFMKGGQPERLAATLIELCNKWNMTLYSCSSWMVVDPELEEKTFTLGITRTLIVPLAYYKRHKRVAQELHALTIENFIDDANMLHGEVSVALKRLSDTGFFINESVDDDNNEDVAIPGEQ